MRIGMVVYNLDVSGGYQKLVLRLAQHISKLGHEAVVYTLSVNEKKCYPDLIKNAHVESLHKGDSLIMKKFSPITEFRKLAHLVDPHLDGLIIHDPYSLQILNFYKPKKKSFKSVWMVNNQIPEDFGTYPPLAPLWDSIHKNIRNAKFLVSTFTSQLSENYSLRRAIRKLDLIAVYDRFNKELAKRIFGKRTVVVYAGADLEEFEALRNTHKRDQGKIFRILSVGVLFPHRRYEDLIEAVSILRDQGLSAEATIVGLHETSPDYSRFLKSRVESLKLQNYISFMDYLSDRRLKDLYQMSDAFVFINDGFTWGISVFEAIAAGLPVIITSNIGAADIIKPGLHGWVVSPKNPKEVAGAVKEIANDPDRAVKITREAYNHAKKLVSWDAYARRMIELVK